MPNNILKEFARQLTIEYARQRIALKEQNLKEDVNAYRGPELFPIDIVNELSFDYWKDLHLLPVIAAVQAFGAEAQIASRDGHERVAGEIPTIKRKINLAGRALIALRREGLGDIDFVRDTLYNDMDNMLDACLARVEKMRMDALTTGKLVLEENGVKMTVDYKVPGDHKQTLSGTSKWDNYEESNPIEDIARWANKVADTTGIRPTRALTSSAILDALLMNKNVRQMFYGDLGGSRLISLDDFNAVLRTKRLPTIDTYDVRARVQKENGDYETFSFFDSKKFVLMPEGKLGDTLVGPTEEAMLDTEVDAKEMAGAYAAVYQEMEPPMIWTKAAMTAIPTFPMADSVFQATVL
ncbi:MAG: major capsid protein [Bacillota bacterium]|nr:major capsid protein [Bacillota bacterium]